MDPAILSASAAVPGSLAGNTRRLTEGLRLAIQIRMYAGQLRGTIRPIRPDHATTAS